MYTTALVGIASINTPSHILHALKSKDLTHPSHQCIIAFNYIDLRLIALI